MFWNSAKNFLLDKNSKLELKLEVEDWTVDRVAVAEDLVAIEEMEEIVGFDLEVGRVEEVVMEETGGVEEDKEVEKWEDYLEAGSEKE